MPKRIQRKRSAGWRMPDSAVYVGRPTKWGNPFRVGGYFMIGDPGPQSRFKMSWCETSPELADERFTLIESRALAVDFFKEYLNRYPPSVGYLFELCGKDLVCWCPLDEPCHADVLLELANK